MHVFNNRLLLYVAFCTVILSIVHVRDCDRNCHSSDLEWVKYSQVLNAIVNRNHKKLTNFYEQNIPIYMYMYIQGSYVDGGSLLCLWHMKRWYM